MKILGFNPNHHGSVCLLEDGELQFFIQEERIGIREKYTGFPFKSFIEILKAHKIDYITWGAPSIFYTINSLNPQFTYWQKIAETFGSPIRAKDFSPTYHHVCHTSHAFYNSGFKESIGVVIDGTGSSFNDWGNETETIFKCSYPYNFEVLYKNIHSQIPPSKTSFLKLNNKNIDCYDTINLSQIYETITMYLGWSRDEAGKTMGLAPYGKYNPDLPDFFINNSGNPEVFYKDPDKKTYLPNQNGSFIDESKNPQLKLPRDPREWHYDESKITDLEKDIAWKVQNDAQQLVGDYIEKAIKETGLKQICCAGGYFLNCVSNYYLVKRFPDIEFYFEPIANDAGTAIGAAKLLWYGETKDTTIRPFKSLYLGKQYSKEELLEGIKKYI